MKSASLAISATTFLRAKLAIGGIGLITASVVSIPSAASAADLYFSDFSNGTIGKIDSVGSVSTFATGFNSPRGIAFDASSNLYVSEQGTGNNNSIKKITPSGNVSTFVSGLADPVFGLAVDASGNLFTANYFANNIQKITPSGNVSTFVSGLNRPYDLAFDVSGNLFESDFDILSGARINKITPSGNVTSNPGSAFSAFTGLAVDFSGNAAVSDVGRNIIIKFSTTTLASTSSINGFSGDLAFDESGNLFVADSGSIKKITTLGTVSTFATTGTNTPFSIAFAPTLSTPTAVPEPFTIIGTLIGGTAALRMRKKLKAINKL
jgi:hypothetical protein